MSTEVKRVEEPEKIDEVMKLVSSRLSQRDMTAVISTTHSLSRALSLNPHFWQVLDFREMSNAGDRLVSAISLTRYRGVKNINLEFARDIEDKHFELIRNKFPDAFQSLVYLNLNVCQKISDKGIEAVASISPNLKIFSLYWNVRVTDTGINHLINSCNNIIDLNVSGCKNITDQSLQLIAEKYTSLESLNLTRCIKVTDNGLRCVLGKCCSLQSLNLYALSSFSDKAYSEISNLRNLRFLDLCGAQNLSDDGLLSVSQCKKLISINLTWCVRVTDVGVIAVAERCTFLESISLFGIVGVSDKCLVALSKGCCETLTTLDVNGCIGIKNRGRSHLLELFPKLLCFNVHS